ncbi:MAG: bifunctional sugar-1-phosphate nucleotidylyltransferase/acetyltransferase [Candidatus Thorarchaeota archaeon]|jgi:bifunctional UDP-N-acetylglucosamine pyrophosphorylase/glucosamine-1-phosphate N-acetyltransferase
MKKAALLAAGDSTRMMPLSANMPKHLLPIAGKPLIFHKLEALRNAGIKDTLMIVGYHGEELKEGIDSVDWSPMRISYVEQKERRGTAHAAGHAKEFADDDQLIVMNGDIMIGPGTFPGLIEQHKKGKHELTLTVFPIDDPSAYGVVAVEDGRAMALIEKPTKKQMVSNLVNAGIYAAGPTLWEAIEKTELSSRKEYEITDSIMMLIKKGNVGAFTIPSWWLDIGKPWDLLEANEKILSGIEGSVSGVVEKGAVLKGEVTVEEGATIRSGAYIEGPAYIGEGSVVGPNCYIRAHTYLSRKVKVGNGCEVKNSLIMDNTSVGHLSYIGDSVIGRKVNFGAGTITANLRHDDQPVRVTVKGKRVSSGRRKLGAIIGDGAKTGIGTLLAPGVVLHQDARTGIGVVVERDVAPGKLVHETHNLWEKDFKTDR